MMLMCKRLRQALVESHRCQSDPSDECQGDWQWVVENLLDFHERQIVYSLESGCPPPAGTWFDLHDLFVQLVVLGVVKVGQQGDWDKTPGVEQGYKRCLLLGLLGGLSGPRTRSDAGSPWFDYWARESWLLDPVRSVGCDDVIVVETAMDGPPRRVEGILTEPFRGWVLKPSAELEAMLSA